MSSLILRLERLDTPKQRSFVDLAADIDNAANNLTALGRWSAVVASAQDACFVLDPQGHVVSISAAAAELLGSSDAGIIGRHFLDITTLLDFDTGETNPEYVDRVPPIAALRGDGMVRSLIRVRLGDSGRLTLDAASTPLRDAAGDLVGSLTFLAHIPH